MSGNEDDGVTEGDGGTGNGSGSAGGLSRLTGRLRDAGTTVTVLVGAAIVVAALLFLATGLDLTYPGIFHLLFEVMVFFLLYSMVVIGVNFQFGYTGLVNFGPVAFFAVGAYSTAILSATDPIFGVGLGYPWVVGLAVGVVLSALLGVLLGVSTLQLRGDYLAIVTLAAAEIIHGLVFSLQNPFGGQNGISSIPTPIKALAGDTDTSAVVTVVILAGVVLMTYGVFQRLSESPYGRVLRAIRADEDVTRAIGKNVFRYKVAAFVYGAVIMGFAGGLLALYLGSMAPGFVSIQVTIVVWIGMLIGGPQNHRAVVAGTGIIMGFQLATRFLNQVAPVSAGQFASIRLMLVGLLLVLIIRFRPEGLWGDPDKLGEG